MVNWLRRFFRIRITKIPVNKAAALLAIIAGIAITLANAASAKAQTLTTLYSFCAQGGVYCTDGATPLGTLLQGSDGNFYGTTIGGGAHQEGTVFKMTPSGTLTSLYSFCSQGDTNCTDGAQPYAGLVQGSDGNFYGTTAAGGVAQSYDLCGYNGNPNNSCGTVFKITPSGELTTLYSFCSQTSIVNGTYVCPDGSNPFGELVPGSDGNFYGTTMKGGADINGTGTVFKITPGGALTTLSNFCSQPGCGYAPVAGLVQGNDGNFYGTTEYGFGEPGTFGTVFKITPSGVPTTLYDFGSQSGDGQNPVAPLVQGSDGNFYGTTYFGESRGNIFKITPSGTLTPLYQFCSQGGCPDGDWPKSGLVQGSDGNFYGTTYLGGLTGEGLCTAGFDGCGTVYKITPGGVLTTLHDFCSVGTYPTCTDGALPLSGLVQGSDFNFYGTAAGGGAYGGGTIFVLAALPVAGISPTSLTFASQDVGTTGPPQPVTLSNTGPAPLAVSSILPSGDFGESDNCNGSVAAAGSCTINVTFTPTQTGTRTGSLTITDNSDGVSGSQQAVSLTGTAINPGGTVSPTSLAFGSQLIQTKSAVKRATLTSSGTTALMNISVFVNGVNAGDFSQSNNCPATLNVGAKCTISVTFTPSLLAAESATLDINDNAANNPQSVALTGTGVPPATLTPTSTNFGSLPEGIPSAPKNFTLKNNQSIALSISNVTFTGTNGGDFSQSNTCGTSLPGGKSCTLSVTFTPSLIGAESAALTVSDNAPAPYNTLTASLSGTGIAQATVSPTSLSYAAQKVGTTSGAKNVTLKNNLSTTLTINGFTFTGADPGDYAVSTTTCGGSLASKASCTISIVFKPMATGARTATLNANDDANNSPQTLSLTGTGK